MRIARLVTGVYRSGLVNLVDHGSKYPVLYSIYSGDKWLDNLSRVSLHNLRCVQ